MIFGQFLKINVNDKILLNVFTEIERENNLPKQVDIWLIVISILKLIMIDI